MKQKKYIQPGLWFAALVALFFSLSSCNEEEFLKEVPLDFYAPENSYITYSDFDAAVLNIQSVIRQQYYTNDNAIRVFSGLSGLTYPHSDYGPDYPFVSILLPTNDDVVFDRAWEPLYRIIYDANVILGRVVSEDSELTEEEKNIVMGEAYFFRAWAHSKLAYLYGGVPIVLEETSEPKRDYTRAARSEVYEQCAADLEFAVANLPGITEVEDASRLCDLAASHLLAEVYLALGRYSDAVTAADRVINDPATALMTERFGNKIEKPE